MNRRDFQRNLGIALAPSVLDQRSMAFASGDAPTQHSHPMNPADDKSHALKTGHHPALLKDAVTTPAGCPIEGLMELERGGLSVTLMNAVITTAKRAKGLMTG